MFRANGISGHWGQHADRLGGRPVPKRGCGGGGSREYEILREQNIHYPKYPKYPGMPPPPPRI